MKYTNCIKDRFLELFDEVENEVKREEMAVIAATALELVGFGKIKQNEKFDFINDAINGNFDNYTDFENRVNDIKNPRKKREISEETKRNNYEKQLEKLRAKYGITD